MKITLNSQQENFVESQINSGKFTSADEAIDTAFKLLEKMNEEYEQWVEETREKIDVGWAELDRG